jgi:hypothetical protein
MWQIDPRIVDFSQGVTLPPRPPDATPQWWTDPLAYRLAEAVERWEQEGDHVGVILMQSLAGGGSKLRTSLAHLFAIDREGEFFRPANGTASAYWNTPYQIVGTPGDTVEESDILRVGVLANLTQAQIRQVDGVALVLVRAADAFQSPARFEVGEPSDAPAQPGDPVTVRRIAVRRAYERGIGYKRMLRYKGAVVDTIREFEARFNHPCYGAATTLIEILSGARLTAREVRTLIGR